MSGLGWLGLGLLLLPLSMRLSGNTKPNMGSRDRDNLTMDGLNDGLTMDGLPMDASLTMDGVADGCLP